MIHNVDDAQVLNEAYSQGYLDCEKDHKIEWETDAWRGGFIFGSFTALLVVILFVMVVRFIW